MSQDLEIVVSLQIRISSNGTLTVAKATYGLAGNRKTRSHIDPMEVMAAAQAFVRISGAGELPVDATAANGPPIEADTGLPPGLPWGDQPCGILSPPPPPPAPAGPSRARPKLVTAEDAVVALLSVGVSTPLARQLVTPALAKRAMELALWMRGKDDVADPDRLFRAMISR